MSAQPILQSPPEPSIEVAVVPWPSGQVERERLHAESAPRVLVVAADADPPVVADDLEDWIREPVDVIELAVRCETVRSRARARARAPRLEPGGVLRHGGHWVAVSPAQVPLVELLVTNLGEVVRICDLRRAHVAAGGADDALAVAACLRRLASTLAEVGLDLHRLRDRGYLLELAGEPAGPTELAVDAPLAAAVRPPRRSSRVGPDVSSVRRVSWARGRAAAGRDR